MPRGLLDAESRDVPLLVLHEGQACMRVLPPTWVGADHLGVDVHVNAGNWREPRVVVYVVDRDAEAKGVFAWAMPRDVDRDVARLSLDWRAGAVVHLDEPAAGRDVLFDVEGGRAVNARLAAQESPLGRPGWLDFAIRNPVPDVLARTPRDLELT
jgi:hypothetical protein